MTFAYLFEEVLRWVYAACLAPPYFTALAVIFFVGAAFAALYAALKVE